ncbi:Unknown protein [Striga hermonthica]|uniref:Transposase n=1 Tax=Striga hermonthica TaxID=68872 RepID=A0A9N7RA13_STRHE|nr:Unknown protein [Striga hermonthica]
MFLSVLAHHKKNRVVKFDFKRSGQTISKFFHNVLRAVLRLHPLLCAQSNAVTDSCTDWRWRWFKGCLGALDGTYIPVGVPARLHPRYRNRKSRVSVNVLGVCTQEMNFSYVLTGWEGSAADSRVLRDAVHRPGGLRVPTGNYYLCDGGYTNGPGFLAPYRGVRYHLDEFGEGNRLPRNHRELFNLRHARARNVIERAFGVLKMRWAVLRSKTYFDIRTQNKIILACCLLQNFIRMTMHVDPMENEAANMMNHPTNPEAENPFDYVDVVEPSTEWTEMREDLAMSIGGRNSQPSAQRRVWNAAEERALIDGLRDLVTRGWRCDNGFRNGYTGILEQHIRQIFPGTTIKAEPHISSKITVWKKNYGLVADMLGTSGFEWNDTGKMITVKEEAVWQAYSTAHPKVKSLRYKSWPYYADWVEIFGKDRATGEGALGFTDAVNDVLNDTNVEVPSPIPTEDAVPVQSDYPHTNFDSFSAQAGESSASGKSKRDGKRKRNTEAEDTILGLLSSVCQETNNRLSELSTRLGYQVDAKEQRIAVYDALKNIPDLTTDERVGVARYLSKNIDEMELFFSLDDDAKRSMVQQILSGSKFSG